MTVDSAAAIVATPDTTSLRRFVLTLWSFALGFQCLLVFLYRSRWARGPGLNLDAYLIPWHATNRQQYILVAFAGSACVALLLPCIQALRSNRRAITRWHPGKLGLTWLAAFVATGLAFTLLKIIPGITEDAGPWLAVLLADAFGAAVALVLFAAASAFASSWFWFGGREHSS